MIIKKAADRFEQKALDDIRDHGLHIIGVAEDDEAPGFAYSIGLFENYAHPEIIIIGLKQDLAQLLLNNMAFDIKEGKTFAPGENSTKVYWTIFFVILAKYPRSILVNSLDGRGGTMKATIFA